MYLSTLPPANKPPTSVAAMIKLRVDNKSLSRAREWCLPKQKKKQPAKNCKIEREMTGEAQIFAGMTKAAAADIEAAHFCDDAGHDEDRSERRQDRQSANAKTARDQGEAAENFQPRQIEGEPHAYCPRKNLVIVDVGGELHWINHFHYAGVNENAADQKTHNSPNELWDG